MTDEQINIAIHEIRGYKRVDPILFKGKAWTDMAFEKDGQYYGGPPPRYTEDLNLIHKAEIELSNDNHKKFVLFLDEICQSYYKARSANASQRAEAFLRVFDKWV